jgi:phage/plasmid-associated DNA primase
MNHKPIIRGTDRGIWRRIQLVPFTQNFEGRADTHLRDKLQAELPGILNWALTGLQAWLTQGVGTAAAVERATDEYQRESDLVSQWLDECVEQDADAVLPAREGFTAFAAWCMAYGYPKPSDRTFQRRMSELNIERKQVGKERTRCYVGVRLLPSVLQGERYERYEPVFGESSLRNNDSRRVYQNECSSVHPVENKHDYSAWGSHIQDERKSNGSVHLGENSVRLDNGSVHPQGEQGRNGNQPTARMPAPSITPVINRDKIRFVLDKLKVRGPTWAREFMDRVEGFEKWPPHVQAAVQAAEREALE